MLEPSFRLLKKIMLRIATGAILLSSFNCSWNNDDDDDDDEKEKDGMARISIQQPYNPAG